MYMKTLLLILYNYINQISVPFFKFTSLFPVSRMSRPSKIVFLDSDGTTAFEYRVPKGQSDMVRHHTNRETSPLASVSALFYYVCMGVCVFPEREMNDESP